MNPKIILSTLLIAMIQGCGSGDSTPPKPTIPKAETEPYFKYLWHLNSTNSPLEAKGYTIDPNADIDIEEAWRVTKGVGVKVAIIDDGFDIYHEDLSANIIDTYNADDGSKNVKYYGFDGIHGNSCAGFIASPINNVGIVGVAPNAKLILIKQEFYDDVNMIRAFEYAKKEGAKVVSCSWGTGQVSEAIVEELKSLYDAGITVVFASGNYGEDLDTNGEYDESEVPWVIGVGGSGENNDVTLYSNYGSNIDLIAPSGNTDISIGILALDNMGVSGSNNQEGIVDDNYAFTSGTSFAAPIVAGTVALMYSLNPYLTTKQVRDILITTTDKVGDGAIYDESGFDIDKRRAYGKINASRALQNII
jgi:subtilisin family serine protease